MFLMNSPSGHLNTLRLSAAAVVKVYSVGWIAIDLTAFLWLVIVFMDLPAMISQRIAVLSKLPDIN